MTCSRLRAYIILPKQELLVSLWVVTAFKAQVRAMELLGAFGTASKTPRSATSQTSKQRLAFPELPRALN